MPLCPELSSTAFERREEIMNAILKLRHHLIGIAVLFSALWLISSGGGVSGPANSPASAFKVRDVSTDQAKALFDSGAVVIDVRGREAFETRHIPGALHIPLEQLKTGIPTQLESARDTDILVYCNEGTARGQESTALLNQAGFGKAVNLRSGIEGWSSSGLPLQKGS
jgi:rhodanese-related sulfurtransferase